MKKILLFILLISSLHSLAQQIQNFSLTNVVNGATITPDTYPSCQGLVIIFTSNACPFDEYYRVRIANLANSYRDKVPVLLVNAHPDANESPENMVKRAQQLGLTVPYLADKDQTLMQSLNAHKSPESFLLKNNNGKFSVVYRGAIDDNAQVAADIKHAYLKEAIDKMIAGQAMDIPEVRPVGCSLKKKQ